MWLASYVSTLAAKGILGGDEHRILWELPLARGYAYLHAIHLANGAEVEATDGGIEEEIADALKGV